MYKVFVNDTPIILSTEKDIGENYVSFPLKEAKLKKIIKKVNKGKLQHVNLYHENEKKLLKLLFKKIKVITAAGGLVKNKRGEMLFIYRKKKWDLPKGKTENGEGIEASAIREVEEETGIEGLEVVRFIRKTYHIFKRKGKYRLKVTHWFEMYSDYEGVLVPEKNEDIEKAKWKSEEKAKKALENSYGNIKLLFDTNLLPGNPENRVS